MFLRLGVISHNEDLRAQLCQLSHESATLRCRDIFTSVHEAHSHGVGFNTDLLFLDLSGMPSQQLDAALELGAEHGSAVYLADEFDQCHVSMAIDSGGVGFLGLPASDEDLLTVIKAASGDEFALNGRVSDVVAHWWVGMQQKQPRCAITPVELRKRIDGLEQRFRPVLQSMLRGEACREIARRLHLSENTVRVYSSKVLKALGVESRSQLIALCHRAGVGDLF